MKSVTYWIATILIASETVAGGAVDVVHGRSMVVTGTPVLEVVTSLGYPAYVLTIIGVWKLLGGATLLAPRLPRLKEWAYAGVVIELTSAAVSLSVRGYGMGDIATPLLLAALAIASWALRPQSRMLGSVLPLRSTRPSVDLTT